MGIDELLRAKREEILCIAAQHGARNVRIFGSVARGEAKLGAMWTSWWIWSLDGVCSTMLR